MRTLEEREKENLNLFAGKNDPAYQAKVPIILKLRQSLGIEGLPLFEKEQEDNQEKLF